MCAFRFVFSVLRRPALGGAASSLPLAVSVTCLWSLCAFRRFRLLVVSCFCFATSRSALLRFFLSPSPSFHLLFVVGCACCWPVRLCVCSSMPLAWIFQCAEETCQTPSCVHCAVDSCVCRCARLLFVRLLTAFACRVFLCRCLLLLACCFCLRCLRSSRRASLARAHVLRLVPLSLSFGVGVHCVCDVREVPCHLRCVVALGHFSCHGRGLLTVLLKLCAASFGGSEGVPDMAEVVVRRLRCRFLLGHAYVLFAPREAC
ncbi:hypothetical protein TRVL_06927 [Trypanosoma vivax]|nr:hypothetical protein TRVL_06927 [Trypanosoma vivax]